MIEQKNSENIQHEIDTRGIIIYWKQWHGKTLTAITLALDYEKRIYSNFNIYKNWKQLNKHINSFEDVSKIRFSYTPWIIVIDEAWINASSRKSLSKKNEILVETLYLVRKLNCSLIWIAQRFESMDVNIRSLSELILELYKKRRWKRHPTFIATKRKQKWTKLEYVRQYNIDNISIHKSLWITYNTLDKAKLQYNKE